MQRDINKKNKGQVMVLTVLIIGGILLTATVIAGYLTFFQIRQANNVIQSTMSVFAADAALEQTLYCYFFEGNVVPVGSVVETNVCDQSGSLNNGASYESRIKCKKSLGDKQSSDVLCSENNQVIGFVVKSFGSIGETERIIETFTLTSQNAAVK